MNLTELLDEKVILVDLQATDKRGVIEELTAALTAAGRIPDREGVLQAVLEREKIMSTGIGKGVAIPHGKCNTVKDLAGVLGIKKEGIDFHALDEQPISAPSPTSPDCFATTTFAKNLSRLGLRRIYSV